MPKYTFICHTDKQKEYSRQQEKVYLFNHSSYRYICKRINRLNTDIKEGNIDNDDLIIAVDSTRIKVTNRGQWMREKWNLKNKKGCLKIHVAVNVKTKKILSKVTDEHVHDSKALPKLVENIIKSNNMTAIGKLFADGAYEGNNIFGFLSDHGYTI